MTKKPTQPKQASPPRSGQELRLRAEQEISGIAESSSQTGLVDPPPENARELLHELQVHQIELEMQNEELRRTQAELEYSRARYLDLYDLAPVGYFTLDEHDVILQANLFAAELLGTVRSTLIGQRLNRFIEPLDRDAYYRHRQQLWSKDSPQVAQLRMIRKGSGPFWARLTASSVPCVDGGTGCLAVVNDITELKTREEGLRRAAAMFHSAREGVMITDANTRISMVNQAFCDVTGYSSQEVLGHSPKMFRSGRHDAEFYKAMWAEIDATGYWQGEIWNRRKNGEIYPQMLSISTVSDDREEVTDYVAVFSDISQLKEATAKLDFLAHHDPLTGLPNRLLLFARIEHCIEISRRERKFAALLMMDLDRFKDVNDSFGHLAGDELLRQVGDRLSTRLRGIDTITRLGGDEFAVLLEDIAHPRDAARVAQDIIDALEEPWRLTNGAEVRIGTSIGISLFPQHGQTSEELLRQADAALYRAKGDGRGHFKYFSDDLTVAALRRINLESLLRRAMAKDELRLYYQPVVELASGRIVGAEALLRWLSPDEGLIAPSLFIPVAEETGLIVGIGEWVLREACNQGRRWIDAGLPPLKLAVNLSLHQFRHGDIEETVARVLAESGFPSDHLVLELTESALMEREAEAVLILKRLRALGVRLAIDDFGTGYSSLAYLKRFPLDTLKVDKSFIDEIPDQSDDCEITSAIIGMAHSLRLTVVAEGVETAEQLAFLRARGCDFYQGYFKSAAMPAGGFIEFLQRHR